MLAKCSTSHLEVAQDKSVSTQVKIVLTEQLELKEQQYF